MSLFAPLWTMVDVRPSSIDKKSVEGQPAVRLCNYTDVYTNRDIDSGLDLMEASASESQLARLRVLPGDVLITKDSESPDDIGVPAFVRSADPHMVCGYHLSLLRPGGEVEGRFLYWYLCSEAAQEYWLTHSFGVTRYSLTLPTVWGLPIPVITLDKQSRIARYLDREVGEMDAVDADLDRLIEKLVERRHAHFTSAFSTLEQTAPKKPLWSLLRPTKEQGFPDEPVLSVYRDYGVVLKDSRDDNNNRTPENLDNYQLVRPGDVVVNKMKAWQGSLGVSSFRGIVSPDYQVCRPMGDATDPRFLHFALRAPQMIPLYRINSKGIRPAQWRLYWQEMGALSIPLPGLVDQGNVVADLDAATARINAMIADAQRLKELLAERRTTLITEVVTGRKEVPA